MFLFLALCFVLSVNALPAWEGMNGRSSIASLTAGASHIAAVGPASGGQTTYLTGHIPNAPGNLTITQNLNDPALFFVGRGQLYMAVNETTVFPVNVLNATTTFGLPMQLSIGARTEGIPGGRWSWNRDILHYTLPGGEHNEGLFYHCMTAWGAFNIFMSPAAMEKPWNCNYLTLISTMRGNQPRHN